MPRATQEWIGKTDNHRAPGKVRQRVFDREGGICHLCGQPIQHKRWDLDHVKALINGGENRESNLKPAHQICHRGKTLADIAEKVKVAAIRARHIGAAVPKQRIVSRGFPRTKEPRAPKPTLPPARLFQPKALSND